VEKGEGDSSAFVKKNNSAVNSESDEEISAVRDIVKDVKDNIWDFFTDLSLDDLDLQNDGKQAPKSWKLSDRVREHFANTFGVVFKTDSVQKM
jgi:hypothetical protein